MNRKILIVTYYWPPSGGVGTQRWMHFAKQLAANGWVPIVYTPENPQFSIKDPSLLSEVAQLTTYRTTIWEPFNLFHKITGGKEKGQVKQGLIMEKSKPSLKDQLVIWLRGNLMIPDPRKFWVKKSIRFLTQLQQEENFSHVITTGPPHSMHLIGLGLKHKLPNMHWLADFRDPWSAWDVLPKLKAGRLAMYRHRMLEKKVLQFADDVLTVSHQLAQDLSGKGMKREVHVLHNGISYPFIHTKALSGQYILGYFGMLNALRNPTALWQALDDYCEAHSDFRERFELRLGGIVSDAILNELKSFRHLGEKVNYLGYLSHGELQTAYAQCNALLLLLNKSDNARWILPVKFFEYLSANRWILALGPKNSDLDLLMRGKEVGSLIDFDDPEGIRDWLDKWHRKGWKVASQDARSLLNRFSHENLVKDLMKILAHDKN